VPCALVDIGQVYIISNIRPPGSVLQVVKSGRLGSCLSEVTRPSALTRLTRPSNLGFLQLHLVLTTSDIRYYVLVRRALALDRNPVNEVPDSGIRTSGRAEEWSRVPTGPRLARCCAGAAAGVEAESVLRVRRSDDGRPDASPRRSWPGRNHQISRQLNLRVRSPNPWSSWRQESAEFEPLELLATRECAVRTLGAPGDKRVRSPNPWSSWRQESAEFEPLELLATRECGVRTLGAPGDKRVRGPNPWSPWRQESG